MVNHIQEYIRPVDWKSVHDLLQRTDVRTAPLFLSPHPIPPEQWPYEAFIDLSLLGLDQIYADKGWIYIEILSSLQSIIDSPLINSKIDGILVRSARFSGTVGMRNYANLGGLLTDLDTPNELLLAFLVLDAEILFRKPDGGIISVPLMDQLQRKAEPEIGEVMVGMRVSSETRGSFAHERVSRTLKDAPIVAAAARLEIQDGTVLSARVAICGASSHPDRIRAVEQYLEGHSLSPHSIQMAARAAKEWANPASNFRGSASYRQAMTEVIVRRTIHSAWKEATQIG